MHPSANSSPTPPRSLEPDGPGQQHLPIHELGPIAALGQPGDLTPIPQWIRDCSQTLPIDDIVALLVERDIKIAFTGLAENIEFRSRLEASIRENLAALNRVLCGEIPLSDVRLQAPVTFAAFQAETHIPQSALQRSYRVGFFTFWREWSRHVIREIELRDIPRDDALQALVRLTQVIQSYQDHVGSQVAEVYSLAEADLRSSSAHLRRRLVKDLLSGAGGPLTPADYATIGYDMSGWHVAIFVSDADEAAADGVAKTLRSATRSGQSLVQPDSSTNSVVWLQRPRPWRGASFQTILDALRPTGFKASVSEPATGPDALRRTYEQVQAIERVRTVSQDSLAALLTFREVALEVLLLRDLDAAAEFVSRELGPLASRDAAAGLLCDTLEASFVAGTNTATAELLGVHEHTVRNRLRRIKELLDLEMTERRAETFVALRLRRLLIKDGASSAK